MAIIICQFSLRVDKWMNGKWVNPVACLLLLAGGILDKARRTAKQGNHLAKIRAFEMCVNRWNCQFVCKDRGAQTTRATCRTNFTLSNMFFLTTFLSISFFRETESTYIIVSYFRIIQRLIFQHNMVTTVVPRVVAQLYYIFMFSCLHSVKVSFTLFSFLMQYNFITGMRLPSNNKIQETTLV